MLYATSCIYWLVQENGFPQSDYFSRLVFDNIVSKLCSLKYDTYREAFKPEKTIYVVAVHCLRLSLTQTFFATNYNFSIWWKVSWKSVSCCWSEISSTSYLFKSCCNIQKKTIHRKHFFLSGCWFFFSLFLPLISTSTYNVMELIATILSLRSDDSVDCFPVQYFL